MSEQTRHYLKQELYELIRSDEDTFEFLQRVSLDGLWYWDLENPEHEWMNPAFWETLGIDPATMQHLASEWQHLINQEDLATALDNFHKHLADPDHPYDQVVRYRHADGSTVWVRCRGRAIRDASGKPLRMLGAHHNITTQMEMEQRINQNLQAIDELYHSTKLALEESQSLFDMSPDALIQSDISGQIIRVNAEACKLLGYSQDELLSMNVDHLVPHSCRNNHKQLRDAQQDNHNLLDLKRSRPDIKARHKLGHEIPVEIRLSNVQTRHGNQVLAAIRDISEYVKLVASLEQTISENKYLSMQVNTDPLTGLYNRRYFSEVFDREFSQAVRHNLPFTVLMIDVDNFKHINDHNGHDIGDKVLLTLTAIFKSLVRSADIAGRLGGDEFIILLPLTNQPAGEALAERIRHEVAAEPLQPEAETSLAVSLSIGVASFSRQDENVEQILKRADAALYQAKQQGRNQVISSQD